MKSTNLSFSGQRFYIGLDVHKKNWSVTVRMNNMELKTFSMDPKPIMLHQYMHEHYPDGIYHSAYEAGFCGFHIHKTLTEAGFKNIVVHPADIPTMHKEKVQKRDPVDSRKIARELEHGSITGIYVPDDFHQQLRSLNRLRERCVSHTTRLKNRIKGYLAYYGIDEPSHQEIPHWSARFLKWLEQLNFAYPAGKAYLDQSLQSLLYERKQTALLIRQLRQFAYTDKTAKKTLQLIEQLPGIGFITAITLYCEIIDIIRFATMEQLAAFAGLVPSVFASGDREDVQGITKRRNHYLRYVLIEAAWVAVRQDEALTERFSTLCRRMKKQDAIVRIAKNLLRRLRRVWLTQQPYVYGVVSTH